MRSDPMQAHENSSDDNSLSSKSHAPGFEFERTYSRTSSAPSEFLMASRRLEGIHLDPTRSELGGRDR